MHFIQTLQLETIELNYIYIYFYMHGKYCELFVTVLFLWNRKWIDIAIIAAVKFEGIPVGTRVNIIIITALFGAIVAYFERDKCSAINILIILSSIKCTVVTYQQTYGRRLLIPKFDLVRLWYNYKNIYKVGKIQPSRYVSGYFPFHTFCCSSFEWVTQWKTTVDHATLQHVKF